MHVADADVVIVAVAVTLCVVDTVTWTTGVARVIVVPRPRQLHALDRSALFVHTEPHGLDVMDGCSTQELVDGLVAQELEDGFIGPRALLVGFGLLGPGLLNGLTARLATVVVAVPNTVAVIDVSVIGLVSTVEMIGSVTVRVLFAIEASFLLINSGNE